MDSKHEKHVMYKKGDIIIKSEATYPTGALVVDGYDERGRFRAHPLGGGPEYVFKPSTEKQFRIVSEEEKRQLIWKRSKFCIEGIDGNFEGWTDKRLWNGWETPRFEFAVAQRFIAALNQSEAYYDSSRDAFITKSPDGEEAWAAEMLQILGGHYCPQILEMVGGDFAAIGPDITNEAIPAMLPGPGIGPNERVIRIPRQVLIEATAEISAA